MLLGAAWLAMAVALAQPAAASQRFAAQGEIEVAFAPREPLGVKVQQSDPAPIPRSRAPALRPALASEIRMALRQS